MLVARDTLLTRAEEIDCIAAIGCRGKPATEMLERLVSRWSGGSISVQKAGPDHLQIKHRKSENSLSTLYRYRRK